MNISVDGASDGTAAFVQDVRVNHCRWNVLMPEELLHRADVVTVRKEVGCKAVPKAMTANRLMDTGKSNR